MNTMEQLLYFIVIVNFLFTKGKLTYSTYSVSLFIINSFQRRNNKTTKIFCGMASNILKHAYLCFRTYLEMVIDLVFAFIFEGKRQAIPDLEKRHAILAQSAVSLAAKIRNKELTSEELVTACIERIKAVSC